ncbi:Endonuclease/exonuclease/phosphatase [Abortiporus biennis]|nr:Endonuclease/exonuclease/phosphatase [Abortiporus biennis]
MPPRRAITASTSSSTSKRKRVEESEDEDEDRHLDTTSNKDGSDDDFVVKAKPTKAGARTSSTKAKSKAKTKVAKDKEEEEEDESELDEEEESDKPQPKKKKAKTSTSQPSKGKGKVINSQPTNKVLPVNIVFDKKKEGCLRVSTWNICGFNSAMKKGFKYYVEAEDADVIVLTETKVNDPPMEPVLTSRYPYRYWSISDKKAYSGTAILSKIKPLNVDYKLPNHPDPKYVKGRIVTLEFEGCFIVGTYTVNAGTGLKTLDEKKLWNKHFEAYIRSLDEKKPVIWTGDLNVAPTELDLTNPKPNWNKTPGYTEAECSSFARVLNGETETDAGEDSEGGGGKFVDVWRKLHPETKHYTYFSYRFQCREKGIGWRLDHFVLSERLVNRVKLCEIRDEIYGASDHCPVTLEIEGEL